MVRGRPAKVSGPARLAFGLDPFRVEAADEQRGVHGNDERLFVENLGYGVTFLSGILRYAQ